MKKIFYILAILIPLFFTQKTRAQVFGGSDCDQASVICNAVQVINDSVFTGHKRGKNEITSFGSCISKNEFVPFWYTFTAATSGSLELMITPKDGVGYNDWDFALFDATDGCNLDASNVVACNFSAECDQPTGISSINAGNWTSNCDNANPWASTIYLEEGKTYALFVDGFEFPPANFTLEFNMNNLPDAATFMDVNASFTADKNVVCAEDSITFTNTSSFPKGSDFEWTFGDGTTDTTLNATHAFKTPGTYDVVLKVYNKSCGDSDTLLQIEVLPKLEPSFSTSNLCFSDTVTFTNTSKGNPTSINWNFGENATPATATGSGPHKVYYSTIGSRNVQLSLDNGVCTVDTTEEITVHPLPTVSATPETSTVCNGQAVNLTATGADSYKWYLEEDSIMGVEDVLTVRPSATSKFYVLGTDTNSCQSKDSSIVIVNPLPKATISKDKEEVCKGEGVTLTAVFQAPSIPSDTNPFSFYNGTSFQDEDSYYIPAITNDTIVNIVVKDINGCTSLPVQDTIKVIPEIVASFTANNACIESEVTITNTSTGNPTNFSWDFGSDASIATETTEGPHSVTYSTVGSKTITLTVDNDACEAKTVTEEITVFKLPEIGITSPSAICNGETATLTASGADTYKWFEQENASVVIGTEEDLTVNPSTSSGFIVEGTDTNGCINTDTTGLIVNPLPTATVTADKAEVCRGEEVTLTVIFNNPFVPASANSYSFDNGVTFQDSNSYTIPSVDNDTTVTVIVTDDNGCTSDPIPYTITVIPKIVPSFTFNNACQGAEVTFTNTSTGAPTDFTWTFGTGASISNENSEGPHTVTYSTAGNKTVTLTVDNATCDSKTLTQDVTVYSLPAVTTSGPTSVCNGQSATLSASGASSFIWYKEGTPTDTINKTAISTVTPALTTSYVVTGTDINNCKNTDTLELVVNPLPTVTVSTDKDSVCKGEEVTLSVSFDAPFAPATSSPYSFDNGLNYQSESSFYIPSVTNDTIVNVVVTDDKGCRSTSHPVSVSTAPALEADFTVSDICVNDTALLSSVSKGEPTSFQWNFGSGASPLTSNTEGPHKVSYTNYGNKTVTLTVAKPGCNPSTITKDLEVFSLPTVIASTSADTSCSKSQVNMSATGAESYQWNLQGDASVIATTPAVSFTPDVSSSYVVTGIDGNGCVNTDTVNISINPLPKATVTTTPTTICEGEAISITASFEAPFVPASSNAYSFDNGTTFQNSDTYEVEAVNSDTTVSVVIKDENGCQSEEIEVIINVLPGITPDFTVNNTCSGDTVTVVNKSAGTPTDFVWDFGAGASVPAANTEGPHKFIYQSSGTKTISLTIDNSECKEQTVSKSVEIYSLPEVTANSSEDTTCSGSTVTLSASGAYNYVWFDQANPETSLSTGASITVNSANTKTYIVEGIDSNNCKDYDTVKVTISPLPTAKLTTSPLNICQGENVTVTAEFNAPFVPSGSNAYSFDNGNTFQDTNSVVIGPINNDTIVNVVVVDEKGCESNELPVSITTTERLTPSFTSSDACQDAPITFTNTSGGNPTDFKWDFGSDASLDSSNLEGPLDISYGSAGTKTITLTINKENCTAQSVTQEVEIFQIPDVTATSSVPRVCKGNSLELTAQGADSYNWYYKNQTPVLASEGTVEVTPMTDTTYIVIGLSEKGCTDTASVSVIVDPIPGIVQARPDTICKGEGSTVVALFEEGFTPSSSLAYSFDDGNNWQNDSLFSIQSIHTDTVISVVIRDINGCMSNSMDASVFLKRFEATVSQTSAVSCFKGSDGAVTIFNVSGGQKPYTYSIDGSSFQEEAVFRNLAKGEYTVTLKDSGNCSADYPVTVNQPDSLYVNVLSKADITCAGNSTGHITVTAVGGISPYRFRINEGNWQENTTFLNVSASNYTIEVSDSNNCIQSTVEEITEPEPLQVSIDTSINVTCNNGSDGMIKISTSGGTSGYYYSFDDVNYIPLDTLKNLVADQYTIFIKDANNCKNIVQREITQPSPITADYTVTQAPDCKSPVGALKLQNVTGGTEPYSFKIGDEEYSDNLEFNGLLPGSYILTVKDSNQCTQSFDALLEGSNNSAKATTISSPASCSGDKDGTATVINVTGGLAPYSYSIKDTLNFQNDPKFEGLRAASYNVYVKTAEGCISQFNAKVEEPAPLITNLIAFDNLTCNQSNTASINIKGVGGNRTYKYKLDGGSSQSNGNFSNISKGPHVIEVSDNKGCKSSYPFVVNEMSPIHSEIVETQGAYCNSESGSAAVDVVSGGVAPYSYSLDNGSSFSGNPEFTNLNAGKHEVIVKDAKGCFDTTNFIITQDGGVNLTAIKPIIKNLSCENVNIGSVTLTNIKGGTKPFQFSLDDENFQSDSTFNKLAGGNYKITIKDSLGCKFYYDGLNVSEPEGINFSLTVEAEETCDNQNGVIKLSNVTGGFPPYYYQNEKGGVWRPYSPNETLITGLKAGQDTIRVKDSSGPVVCSLEKSIALNKKPAPKVFLTKTPVICFGDTTGKIEIISVLGGEPDYHFSLKNGEDYQTDSSFNNLGAGNYKLLLKDEECVYDVNQYFLYNKEEQLYDTIYSGNINIPQPEQVAAEMATINTTHLNSSGSVVLYNITGGTAPYFTSLNNSNWEQTSGDSAVIDNLSKGAYTVYLKDKNGCSTSFTEVEIEVPFLIPNLITPNGDGKNEVFQVLSLPYGTGLDIVNRWGSRVYQNDNYDNSWDAENQPDGVYYYTLKLRDGRQFKGWLEVVR